MSLHAPWLPRGTVYGTLLNFRREWDLWAPKMSQAPYKAAPRAPVLYVKTANSFAPTGAAVPVTGAAELGATLGLVIGDFELNGAATGSNQAQAAINHEVDGLARVAGCVLLDDLSLPHASYYRPAIRYRNRDGFLVCAPAVTPLREVDLKALRIEARVNGALVQTVELSTLVRDAAALLADVGAFMTLQPGDVLLLGSDCLPDGTRPRVTAGDRVEISAPGLAPLMHTLAQEAA
ncbi:fumarylacetoacetate hydrolase family protein [Ottowia sp.]|uniref:fumarylacetoacetate hydrolase family protein n=1 Tax=Ottowia sp. TaxID=1898956 RepID=UPI0025D7C750|nr:fumarylacetoacetate hydrolase family protein [Ottowia sp.]